MRSKTSTDSLYSIGFCGFLGTQFLGAFNDNVFKILIICAAGMLLTPEAKKDYIPLASAVFTLPYLLLSAFAGYFSDRYSKRTVMIVMKIVEVVIMVIGWYFLVRQAIYSLLIVLFFMGAQSAFFSPAKYGYLPELLSKEKLSFGNGLTQLLTFLAIIIGGWCGSQLSDTYKNRFVFSGAYPVLFALLGILCSIAITHTRDGSAETVCSFDPITPHWKSFRYIRKDKPLLFCFIGNTYFWFLGTLFLSNIPFIVQDELHCSDAMIGYLQGIAALGIGIGSATAGYFSKDDNVCSNMFSSGISLAIFSILFGVFCHHVVALMFFTVIIGFCAGLYQLPMSIGIQTRSPDKKRGSYLAAGNALDCISMLSASALHWLLIKPLHCSAGTIIIVLGCLTIVFIVLMNYFMPQALLHKAQDKLIIVSGKKNG